MSAVKIILKRSSIPGKRPSNQLLEAGELGLNTNAIEPGIFFETSDGNIVKAGPTAYLSEPPTVTPAKGETWADSDTGVLNVGTAENQWRRMASPFLGGTNGYAVFVAPDYEYSSDSLKNDGQATPFASLNRAIIEVSRVYINDLLSGSYSDRRFTIFLAPGQYSILNGPGKSLNDFDVNFENGDDSTPVTQESLEQFNLPAGGIFIPAGISLVGLDQKKTILRPSYVPLYNHPDFPSDYQLVPNGYRYNSQPLSSIFLLTGSSYLSNFSVEDKFITRNVSNISIGPTGLALFKTVQDHNLSYNDTVYVSYTQEAFQASSNFGEGLYYVNPVTTKTFYLSTTPLYSSSNPSGVFTGVSAAEFSVENRNSTVNILTVSNIYPYVIPPSGQDYTFSNYSAHRLSIFSNAYYSALNEFYSKVQRAFPSFFGGRVNNFVARPFETEIVAPTVNSWPDNLSSNSTNSSSAYIEKVNLRTSYGMNLCDFDGDRVSGFKSLIVNEVTSVALQRDPAAYEIYSNQDNAWQSLTRSTANALNLPVTSVPLNPQLQALNEVQIENIRYFYKTLTTPEGLSIGLANPEEDFRHYGFRFKGQGAYGQLNSVYTIGCAVGAWAQGGAIISLTNSTTNFGSIAILSEGFSGINTRTGALPTGKGFNHYGIYLPLALTEDQVKSDAQKDIFPLGSVALFADLDPNDTTNTQRIFLSGPFDPASILPYTLAPGSAVYIQTTSCVYRAYFVTDGTETVIPSSPDTPCGGAILRVRSWDSQVPVGDLEGVPYIRRFVDPRADVDRTYGLLVQSTSQTSVAPQEGSVIRLNLSAQSSPSVIKRDRQFDPGIYGGYGQVFTVAFAQSLVNALSPSFNNKISNNPQSSDYVVVPALADFGRPWTQVVTDASGNTSFQQATGNYATFNGKNYYSAENDSATSLYFVPPNSYSTTQGPARPNPGDAVSPWVLSNPLFKAESVTNTNQGVLPDPLIPFYESNNISNPEYLRGVTPPAREVTLQRQLDYDDGSNSFGMIYRNVPSSSETVTLSATATYQSSLDLSFPPGPYSTAGTFGRPEIVEFSVYSPVVIRDPREGTSILRFESADGLTVEYMRVILFQNSFCRAIRNYYPGYSKGTLPNVWPASTRIINCVEGTAPEPFSYDPEWSYTKSTILRYYALMGYQPEVLGPALYPKPYGFRTLLNTSLNAPLSTGYANYSVPWPIEFNTPSTVIANTHSWQYAGYLDYSRGLPKYQTSELSRKLAFDYLGSNLWGGKLTMAGIISDGDLVFLGPVREAQTGNYYLNENPELNFSNRTLYQSPVPVRYPKQIQVFNCDDFSNQFNGSKVRFTLTVDGIPVAPAKLLAKSMFVNLGGAQQQPGLSYSIEGSDIIFVQAPNTGATVAVKVITSEDGEESLTVIPATIYPNPDGAVRLFTLNIPSNYANLPFGEENLFVTIGGIQQVGGANPNSSYTLGTDALGYTLFFNEPPAETVTIDIRIFTTGPIIQDNQTIRIVNVDDISFYFDGVETVFPLEISGEFVNPNLVTQESTIVQLGGVIQIPGEAYTIDNSRITFAQAPEADATSDIRVILSNSNLYIACPNPPDPYSNA